MTGKEARFSALALLLSLLPIGAAPLLPGDRLPPYPRGVQLLNEEKFEEAIEAFTEAIQKDETNADCYFYRGYCYYKVKSFFKALSDFRRAVRIGGERQGEFVFWRGVVREEIGDFAGAIADYTEALRLDPKKPSPLVRRGVLFCRRRLIKEAIRDLTVAIAAVEEEDRSWCYLWRGRAFLTIGDREKARSDFEHAYRTATKDTQKQSAEDAMEALVEGETSHEEKASLSPPLGSIRLHQSSGWVPSGEKVMLIVEPFGGHPVTAIWRQEPADPSGVWDGEGLYQSWTAPSVDRPGLFRLHVQVQFPSHPLEASASVFAVPKGGADPSLLPELHLTYPWENGIVNVVGEGCVLPLRGFVSDGDYPVRSIEVRDSNGDCLYSSPQEEGIFEIPLTKFGIPGPKTLTVRVQDRTGREVAVPLTVINDDRLLLSHASWYLSQYASFGHPPQLERFGEPTDGTDSRPIGIWTFQEVEDFSDLILEACDFWKRLTGLRFTLVRPDEKPPTDTYIVIQNCFKERKGNATANARREPALLRPVGTLHQGTIRLLARWLEVDRQEKIATLVHEIGHILFLPQGHTQCGSLMDSSASENFYFHPFMQVAVRLLYGTGR